MIDLKLEVVDDWEGNAVFAEAINHERLMQTSGRFVESLARNGAPHEMLVANRILDSQSVWVRWENEHARLMRTVVQHSQLTGQVSALKSACFSLIHRKALFEHLRDEQLRGRARQQLVRFFHSTRGYSEALVSEHDSYLRSACSFLCSSHVGSTVMIDGVFQDPMQRYQQLYAEYFKAFCEGYAINEDGGQAGSKALLPLLKRQIAEQRRIVLDLPRLEPNILAEPALRRPTGDTERLRADAVRVKFGRKFL
jgi:hypothetical protein